MKYFDRDRSWVEFNARILHEACRDDNPLMERIRFLGIVSTNFDEFFRVRVASLVRSGEGGETLDAIGARVREITARQYGEIARVFAELERIGIRHVAAAALNGRQKSFAEGLFRREVFPLLTPLRTDGRFPEVVTRAVYAAFSLRLIPNVHVENLTLLDDEPTAVSLVQLPVALPRIVWLPEDESGGGGKSFILLDEILLEFGTQLFPGYTVEGSLLFSVDRDADMGVDEGSGEAFIEAMEDVIEQRRSSFAVRLMWSGEDTGGIGSLVRLIQERLGLPDRDVYRTGLPLRADCLSALAEADEMRRLQFEPWRSANPFRGEKSLWHAIRERDRALFLPYESFDPVVRMVEEAADDPKVLAVKTTLYRTEKNSAIVRALSRAARNGKQVTAFVELKARFDEERNIGWARGLEKAGAIVIYGIVNLKVHAKAMMVIRRERDGIRRYVHLSTGNYNARTAQVYSDAALLTADDEIAGDVTLFFNLVSGYSALQTMTRLAISPVNMRSRLLSLIRREAESSTEENPGLIVAKLNALGDEELIDALYGAAEAGVQIMLNVRGICRLLPGAAKGGRIRVVSVVGRYLEHSRLVYFKNGGNEELFLSSADWMPRNLDRRVELLVPVTDRECFAELKENLMTFFRDDTHAHVLRNDGTWAPPSGEGSFSAQQSLHEKYAVRPEASQQPAVDFEIRRRG